MSKLEALKRLAAQRTKGEWAIDPPNGYRSSVIVTEKWKAGFQTADAEFIAACANNIDKLLAVVEAAKGVSVFLQDRWCEDHAYRSKHLQPLVAALAALEEG